MIKLASYWLDRLNNRMPVIEFQESEMIREQLLFKPYRSIKLFINFIQIFILGWDGCPILLLYFCNIIIIIIYLTNYQITKDYLWNGKKTKISLQKVYTTRNNDGFSLPNVELYSMAFETAKIVKHCIFDNNLGWIGIERELQM